MAALSVLIAGAGASGSVFGAALRRSGLDVTLLGRESHLDAVSKRGLRVEGIFGDYAADGFSLASTPSDLRTKFSLILVTVKSYDTEKLADSIGHLIDKDGIVVSLQNGLGNIETVARRFGSQQVLGGRVIFGSEMVAPGRVRVTVIAQPVAIGPAPKIHGDECANLHARAIEIAAAINSAGVPAEAVDDITPVLWLKVLYNVAMNPLGALLRCHYGALGEVAETRSIMEDAVTEAFAVSQNLHVDLGFRSADDFIGHLYDKLLPPTYDHRPSMLYDLEKRGRTEIEALNGMIVQLGERYSVPTPVNRMLTSMIHARERLVRAQLSIPAGE